jgi:general secretion pathway protein A
MYTSFFGLNEKPFSITPDPRYLFMSERHSEALAHLVYGVTESGGFLQLTGEVGTGKTTLVRSLLLNRMPDNADVAVVLNPQITAQEFLLTICEELSITPPEKIDSIKALTDALNQHLLSAHAAGRRTILIVDEAQNLAPAVLEQVRLLTNLETAKQKLLQIILIGQPELRELLGRNDLRQLAQRITGRYHLEPLTKEETIQYIEHRLRVAGALSEVIDSSAKKEIFRLSGGVPRLINVICDRALLGAYSQECRVITKRLIRHAAAEVSGELARKPLTPSIAMVAGLIGMVIIILSIWSATSEINLTPETSQNAAVPISATEKLIVVTKKTTSATLADKLSLAQELTTKDFAFSSLFSLWDLNYKSESDDGCSQAAAAGLACFIQRGSWNGLSQLDRPAILTVIDAEGISHELVLIAINEDIAHLSIGGVAASHPINEVTDIWFGDFLMLWRPPSSISLSLSSKSFGPDVVWLRQSLAAINKNYASVNANKESYDVNLQNIVRQFQKDNRLEVDGLVGQQTLIIINSLLGLNDSPRLSASRLAQD